MSSDTVSDLPRERHVSDKLLAGQSAEHLASALAQRKSEELHRSFGRLGNYSIIDEKHFAAEDIAKSVGFLFKILDNVVSHPTEDKYRKIRYTNLSFIKHIQQHPGCLPYLEAAGWHAEVADFEKVLACSVQPSDEEAWQVLEAAHVEASKLNDMMQGKLARKAKKKQQAENLRLDRVRQDIESDRERRKIIFPEHTVVDLGAATKTAEGVSEEVQGISEEQQPSSGRLERENQ